MNERIKELALQAGAEYSDYHSVSLLDKEIEVFAELIVRECARLVQGVPTDSMGYHTADQKIKDHFGVV